MPARNAAERVQHPLSIVARPPAKTLPARTLSIPGSTLTDVVLSIFVGYIAYPRRYDAGRIKKVSDLPANIDIDM